MHPNETLIHGFYTAFRENDYRTMQEAYHARATFSDPVFGELKAHEVKAMWKMLITAAKDLEITYSEVKADDEEGSCRWDARYTFSGTGRKVHNMIKARFIFKDGKILRHDDRFSFWNWARMAFGQPGLLLGWSPYLIKAVRGKVRARLEKFMGG